MTRLFLCAGEASGDALGAALMGGLHQLAPDAQLMGVGGHRMEAAGLHSLFPMAELSVMGLVEILPQYRRLKRRLDETVQAVIAAEPDALVTIDLPEFNLRLAKAVKAARPGIRSIHYVAPSVWAWRPGRAARMARMVDQVLALLPFEPPYMQAAGMRCDFVGHPVVSEPQASAAEAQAFRNELGSGEPLILALPGSRRAEVTRLAPIFGATLCRVAADRPGTRVVVPAGASVGPLVRDAVADWPVPVTVIDPADGPATVVAARKRAAFRAADIALAASGTVSLELAAAGTPMVIGYRMAPLTMALVQAMSRTDTVTLVNLVSETRVVPEFLGKGCTPQALAKAITAVLDAPDAQRDAADLTMARLGRDDAPPGLRAAEAVLDGLRRRSV